MNGADVLLTTAELSLALGGFGSVVAAFISNREEWDPMEVVRFRALIVITLTSALIALIPFPLFYSGIEEPALWAVASTMAATTLGFLLAGMLWYARAPMVSHGSVAWSIVAMAVAVAALTVSILNALGTLFTSGFSGYFIALLLQLVLAGLYFIRLIVLSGPQAKREPPTRD